MKHSIVFLLILLHSLTVDGFNDNAKVELGQRPSKIGLLDEISFEVLVINLTEDSTFVRRILNNSKIELKHPNTGEWTKMTTALDVLYHPSRGGRELLVDTLRSFITVSCIASKFKKEQIELVEFKDYEFKVTYDVGTSSNGWLPSKKEMFFTISAEKESGEDLKAFDYLMSLENPVFLGYSDISSLMLSYKADYYYNHSKAIIQLFPNSKYVRNAELFVLIYDYYATEIENRGSFGEKFKAISDKYKNNVALQDAVVGYMHTIKYKYQKE